MESKWCHCEETRPDVCNHVGAHKPFCHGIRYDRMTDSVVAVTDAQAAAGIADESCRCCGHLRENGKVNTLQGGWPVGGLQPNGFGQYVPPALQGATTLCGGDANAKIAHDSFVTVQK